MLRPLYGVDLEGVGEARICVQAVVLSGGQCARLTGRGSFGGGPGASGLVVVLGLVAHTEGEDPGEHLRVQALLPIVKDGLLAKSLQGKQKEIHKTVCSSDLWW